MIPCGLRGLFPHSGFFLPSSKYAVKAMKVAGKAKEEVIASEKKE
jgi:hypothetical protein